LFSWNYLEVSTVTIPLKQKLCGRMLIVASTQIYPKIIHVFM